MKTLTRILSRNRHRNTKRSYGCFGRLLILLLVYYTGYMLLRGPIPADQFLIAHRGGNAGVPENTLTSFNKAVEIGVDVLEFDVQRTADGMLVVIHDETVDRTTNGTGKVAELTFEELRALDAGGGEHVPTFEEVIQLARDNGVQIFPEAKSPELYPGLGTEMLALLTEYDYVEQTVIQSFDPETLENIKTENPASRTCLLTGLWKFNISFPEPKNGDAICPMAEMVILYPWMVRSAHQEGKLVFTYFGAPEHSLTARILFALGVDGVMVDDPAAFR